MVVLRRKLPNRIHLLLNKNKLKTILILVAAAALISHIFFPVVVVDVDYGLFSLSEQTKDINKGIKLWRLRLKLACQEVIKDGIENGQFNETHVARKEAIEVAALNSLELPDPATLSSQSRHNRPQYRYCKNVFIDLGTNRGDSIGYAVDAVLDVCSPTWVQADPSSKRSYRVNKTFPHPHLNVDELKVYGKGYKSFGLLGLLQRHILLSGGGLSAEDMCVYGMEGNPFFTEKLQKLQNYVDAIRPRPLRHLYIHTESVVAPKDGPTKLYIDQFSVKDHVRTMYIYIYRFCLQ
jgi:hypothetical protein